MIKKSQGYYLANKTMTKDFIKDLFKYLPAQVAPGIIGIISIPIITRIFRPIDYGNYNLVIATVMVLTTLLSWIPMSIIRFYPSYERDEKLDLFFGNIISLTFLSLLVLSPLFFVFLLFIKSNISSEFFSLMNIGLGVFFITVIFDVFKSFLRATRQAGWFSGFSVWKNIASLGMALVLIFCLHRGIASLFWGTIFSVILILPFIFRKAKKNIASRYLKIDFSLIKKMAKYSFPLVLGNLAAWILSLSDRYIIEIFRGTREVGLYSANYNIAHGSIILISSLFWLSSGPILMHIWEKEGEDKSKDFLTKVTRYYFMICLPMVIGISVLSKPVINIMAGEQYFEGYKIIPFVSAGIFLLGLQKRFNDGLLLCKRTNPIAFSIIAAGFLNILLNRVFVPEYGYFAAAITTFISYAFLLFVMVLFSRRFIIWKFPFVSLLRVSCASTIMGLIIFYVGNNLTSSALINIIFGIGIGVGVYFFALLILGEFSKEEIKVFTLLKHKVFSHY